ncbi:MAG TPA: TRAP transporter permease [Candidatus Limnocylindria bacterium]|nr:TRAP transporter permease [Candidatus Limnocylindria bacterium]
MEKQKPLSSEQLEQLVKEADLGGRDPGGRVGLFLSLIAAGWSLFQVWYASPLPFVLRLGLFNDTEARAIHLAVAIFLAFTLFPAFRASSRRAVPLADWVLAAVGAFCASYLYLFYAELAQRPGTPTQLDLVVGITGIAIMLEATRRAMGVGMLITTGIFLLFVFSGPYMPEVIQHKGASLQRLVSHMWLTTEGVYGVALGVSVQFIFLFVLFGTLLDIAGAGNYMMQISVAFLGHLRGGPAKVAVVSSALNGLVSGSSVSNVVSGGIFTIPMMKRTGYSGVKAGAIEATSSINGQIMPPVMGAAAFLMVEYVGIPYTDIIKHAALPAIISYVALFYMVHLEALKYDLQPIPRTAERGRRVQLVEAALGGLGTLAACAVLYYVVIGVQQLFGAAAGWALTLLGGGAYLGLLAFSSRYPDLPPDDPTAPIIRLPEPWPTVRSGLHFTIPLIVLLWCLMVEELSPGLSAFWATATVMAMVVAQPPLLALFRRQGALAAAARRGLADLGRGLVLGARNMIGIGVATASAGLIVGVMTLTGMGFMMTEFVEYVSGGNVLVMLMFTGVICLLIGAGVPTTANYILVATIMAPVIVELGAQAEMVIPLIAVHLFVFYFGIMADVTPPVGLASYAAAAISGENPNLTGLQATWYSFRTAVLPFVFIFNPQLLFIGVSAWWEVLFVIASATVASLLFAAATMGWFRTRCNVIEIALLLLATFLFFRPDWVIDRFHPRYVSAPAGDIFRIADRLQPDELLIVTVKGESIEGDDVRKVVALPMGTGSDGRERIRSAGATIVRGEKIQITNVRFGSPARKLGVSAGYTIQELKLPNPRRPAPYWGLIPAIVVALAVWLWQGRRRARRAAPAPRV